MKCWTIEPVPGTQTLLYVYDQDWGLTVRVIDGEAVLLRIEKARPTSPIPGHAVESALAAARSHFRIAAPGAKERG